jgi:hypothetical protein
MTDRVPGRVGLADSQVCFRVGTGKQRQISFRIPQR